VIAPRSALALGLACCACGARSDEACWIADRAAGRVTLLDARLLPVASVAVEAPRLLALEGETLWIAGGPSSVSGRATRLWRIEASDRWPEPVRDLESIRDLCVHPAGGVALVEERLGRDAALWHVDSAASVELELAGMALVAAGSRRLLVALDGGALVLLRSDGAVLEWTALAGVPRDLCAGDRADTWWVLWGDDVRLTCFGPGFVRLAELPVPAGTVRVAADRDGVWTVGEGGAAFVTSSGELLRHADELAPGDEPVAVAAAREGALWLLPGAVLRSDVLAGELRVRASQGGASELVDLALANGAGGARRVTPRRRRRRARVPCRARRAGCDPCWP